MLGKHSGRHALQQAFAELGFRSTATSSSAPSTRFKELADRKGKITLARPRGDRIRLAARARGRPYQLVAAGHRHRAPADRAEAELTIATATACAPPSATATDRSTPSFSAVERSCSTMPVNAGRVHARRRHRRRRRPGRGARRRRDRRPDVHRPGRVHRHHRGVGRGVSAACAHARSAIEPDQAKELIGVCMTEQRMRPSRSSPARRRRHRPGGDGRGRPRARRRRASCSACACGRSHLPVRRRGHRPPRRPLPDATCGRREGVRRGAAGRRRRAALGRPRRAAPEKGLLDAAQGARRVRQPAPGAPRRHRPDRRARADRRRSTSAPRGSTEDAHPTRCTYSPRADRAGRPWAFRLARRRASRVVSVDKANVLETSQLWRHVVTEMRRAEFPDVDAHPRAGRLVRDEPGHAAAALRRGRHREPVRRHPLRRAAAVAAAWASRRRLARRARRPGCTSRCTARRPTSRAGRRQPARDDPVGGDDVALGLGMPEIGRAIERPRSTRFWTRASHRRQVSAACVPMGGGRPSATRSSHHATASQSSSSTRIRPGWWPVEAAA